MLMWGLWCGQVGDGQADRWLVSGKLGDREAGMGLNDGQLGA